MNQPKHLVSENDMTDLEESSNKGSWCIVFQAETKENNRIVLTLFGDQ